jgi:hypothetical protein
LADLKHWIVIMPASVCTKLALPVAKLPHYRKSSHQHYLQYYDDQARCAIAEKYKNDIAAFNYNVR